jgi:hypothetical protein
MAVRARAYLKQGGMNRRRAGEDFYFLHKIISLGGFTELNTTRVIPSPRPSHRVPFGTGRAVQSFLRDGSFQTYPVEAFKDLQDLANWILSKSGKAGHSWENAGFSDVLNAFLRAHHGVEAMEEMRRNTSSSSSFQKRFFQWFDAFKAMKFIHFARDNGYGSPSVESAAAELLSKWIAPGAQLPATNPRALLEFYRELDRVD